MKRIVFILAIFVMTATSISAQVIPGMKYSELKDIYSPRSYVRTSADPYSPERVRGRALCAPYAGSVRRHACVST